MDVELPTMLDSIIGVPGSRGYDDFVAGIPVRLSELREMFLEGRVQHPKLYQPFRFDPIKDVVLLTVLAALVELGAASGFSLSMNGDVAGVTITESTGVVRTICLVYGTYAPAVVPMVNAYLSDVEATIGTLPTFEVLIVPCSQYKIGSFPDFAPDPVLSKPLPGVPAAKRTFVDPDVLFDSVDFGDLMSKLRAELGV
jgi:hypothetical protein